MLAFLNDLVKFRISPKRLLKDDFSLHRDRVLAWVHLLSLFLSAILVAAMFKVQPDLVGPLIFCNLAVIASTYIFKRFGNNILSGNLLVFMVFGVLMSCMMPTGGLFSDNLVWLILVPFSAFLLANRTSGLAWSFITFVTIFGIYYLEINAEVSYRALTLDLGPDYYLVSYVGLFSMVLGITTIFVKGGENLLYSIKSTSEKLRDRSIELESKNELLRAQEVALKRSNQDLELLAYVASHDLKEPLRMINVYSKMLDKSLHESMSDRDKEFLKYIREGGSRMQTMLEDLLAYGKLGRENKGHESVDLNRTMLLVENNLKLRLIESEGTINWDQLAILKGRSTHFIQLFQNLIANSLKFSREGVAPAIEITGHTSENSYIVRLADNGLGIPEEDIDKIFGVFQRLGNSHQFEGSGIGLATVSRIMEGLEGSIRVESVHGLGTTFILSFPQELLVATEDVERSSTFVKR